VRSGPASAAAAEENKAGEAFRFVAIADTHISDARALRRFRSFLHACKALKPAFVLHMGDICGHVPELLPRIKEVSDNAGQPSIDYGSALCLVQNRTRRPKVFLYQQGVDGYAGCKDITVRRHKADKSGPGEGDLDDLECWIWGKGKVEFSEFYIRFDLAESGIPRGARIRRAALVFHCNRQNFQSVQTAGAAFKVLVMREAWSPKMTFESRPKSPAWFGESTTEPAPDLRGTWPFLGGSQVLDPPRPIRIDLTPLKDDLEAWLREPAGNHGLVFSPTGKRHNLSVRSSRTPMAILRPRLVIEIE
jgi:hypothetical protein